MISLYAVVPILRNAELQFWKKVARLLSLKLQGKLFITGRSVGSFDCSKGGPILLPYYRQTTSYKYLLEDDEDAYCLYRRISNQAELWREPYSYDDFLKEASIISFHLSIIKPKAVLIWNWHRPEGYLTRIIAEAKGFKCWDIERTPWPSMLTIDSNGQLSETKLTKKLSNFCELQRDSRLSLNEQMTDYISRGTEYIQKVRNQSKTWWNQPDCSSTAVEKIELNSDYMNASNKILFVGQVDNDVQNFLFNPKYTSNIHAFESLIEALPKGSFVVGKHHPMSNISVSHYQDVIDQAKHVTGIWSSDLDVAGAFTLVDHVVAVNSSMLFEAMIYEKSCFSLGQTMLSGLNVFYECNTDDNLREAINAWLSESRGYCADRHQRFVTLTGFAVSEGLISFEDFKLTFDDSEKNDFLIKWINSITDQSEQNYTISLRESKSQHINDLADQLAQVELVEHASIKGDADKELISLRLELDRAKNLSIKIAIRNLMRTLKDNSIRRAQSFLNLGK